MIHRESFRASVLHLSEIQAVLQSIAEKKSVLTTPSLLSKGTPDLSHLIASGGRSLVNVFGLSIAGDHNVRGTSILDEIIAVVSEDAGARGREFVDASTEGIVLERNRASKTKPGRRASAGQPLNAHGWTSGSSLAATIRGGERTSGVDSNKPGARHRQRG